MRSKTGLKLFVLLAGLFGTGMIFTDTLWAGEALWVDVRTASEFNAGHVEQAINIPYKEIAVGVEALDLDKNSLIYLYCKSGRRSGIAMKSLEALGYTQVVNVGSVETALEQSGNVAE